MKVVVIEGALQSRDINLLKFQMIFSMRGNYRITLKVLN